MTPGPEHLSGSVNLESLAFPQAADGRSRSGATPNADVAVLELTGEIDVGVDQPFHVLLDEVALLGASHVIVDVTGVTFCDAHGLGLLVVAAERLQQAGARLSVRGADAKLFRLFQLTDLVRLLRVERPPSSEALLRGLHRSREAGQTQTLLTAALQLVVTMTQAVVHGADGASITLPTRGRFETIAASNDTVLEMDHDQYETGEGPCLDAARTGVRHLATSLDDETRWPSFVPRARARGICSILSTPVMAGEAPLGALNLYSRSVSPFAAHETDWADQFASEAAIVLSTAKAAASPDGLDAQVREALLSREVIALAQGVMMERYSMSAPTARAALRRESRRTSQPLRDLCERLVAHSDQGSSREADPRDGAPGA
jgi:anti-anti-sigma factor